MSEKWSEESQLKEAYRALKTQPYNAQVRMLAWLESRIFDDHRKATAAKQRPSEATK